LVKINRSSFRNSLSLHFSPLGNLPSPKSLYTNSQEIFPHLSVKTPKNGQVLFIKQTKKTRPARVSVLSSWILYMETVNISRSHIPCLYTWPYLQPSLAGPIEILFPAILRKTWHQTLKFELLVKPRAHL